MDRIAVTLIEAAGPRRVSPAEVAAPPSPPQGLAPAAGDDPAPSNFVRLDDANVFVAAATRLVFSAARPADEDRPTAGPHTKDERVVAPDRIAVEIHVLPPPPLADGAPPPSDMQLVFGVTVEAHSPFSGATAAAQLDLPRTPGLALLQEDHQSGDVRFEPKVVERRAADAAFAEAASSATKTATLSDTAESAFTFKLDKVAPGAHVRFTARFIVAGGLVSHATVATDAADPMRRHADVAVVLPHTELAFAGVPVEVALVYPAAASLVVPAPAVLTEEAKEAAQSAFSSTLSRGGSCSELPALDLIHLCPSTATCLPVAVCRVPERRVCWSTGTGAARPAVVKARLSFAGADSAARLASQLAYLSMQSAGAARTPMVDDLPQLCGRCTLPEIYFNPDNGAACDLSNVTVKVPTALRGAAPVEAPHRLYVIVDVSGSTSMRTAGAPGDGTFLDAAKALLHGCYGALVAQVEGLRAAGSINRRPVDLRLWSFSSDVVVQLEGEIPNTGAAQGPLLAELRSKTKALRSGGCTDYDAWARQLRSCVAAAPAALHSVLLVTDGGATSRERFLSDIKSVAAQPGLGFFQVDCVGYGPWLDARTVEALAVVTGGEAVMVESLDGSSMQKRVLGLLARSMLRAASSMTLTVTGAAVLAAAGLAGDAAPRSCTGDAARLEMPVLPGTAVALALLHCSDVAPAVSIGPHAAAWPAALPGADRPLGGGGRPDPAAPETQRALRHLVLIEPAYASGAGSALHPPATEMLRLGACLRVSVAAQLPAPSVTKGLAVATVEMPMAPVPEDCRPDPEPLCTAWRTHIPFRGEESLQLFGARSGPSLMRAMPAAFCSAAPCGAVAPGAALMQRGAAPVMKQRGCPSSGVTEEGGAGASAPPPGPLRWLRLTSGGFASHREAASAHDIPGARLSAAALKQQLEAIVGEVCPAVSSSAGAALPASADAIIDDAAADAAANEPGGKAQEGPRLVVARLGRLLEAALWLGLGQPTCAAGAAPWGWVGALRQIPGSESQLLQMWTAAARCGGVSASLTALPPPCVQALASAGWPWDSGRTQVRDLAFGSAVPTATGEPVLGAEAGGLCVGTAATVRPTTPKTMVERQGQVRLFVPAVRRDIYAVLLSPDAPHAAGHAAGAARAGNEIPFKSIMAVRRGSPAVAVQAVLFCHRGAAIPADFTVAPDAEMLQAIQQIGQATPFGIAVTEAFETFLAAIAAIWDVSTVRPLSVAFLVAFGTELTPRLDVHHRIRSVPLPPDDLALLRSSEFIPFVDQTALAAFQGP